jgi:hypothetical protein
MKKILNGLLVTTIAFLAASLATGFPETFLQWQIIGIGLIGTLIGYSGQTFLFPSTSILGAVNARDFLKASCIGVGNFIGTWAAAAVTATIIDWKALLGTIASLIIGYFVKQLNQAPTGIPPTK